MSSSSPLNPPRVSVLLPAHNAAPYVARAVESVLRQTYEDLEVIVIDDGSTDGTGDLVRDIRDPRLRVYHQDNRGLARALNRALGLARGEFLARQDADDFSFPRRFEYQVRFLERNPECGLLGTAARVLEGESETSRTLKHPTENGELQFRVLFDSPFVHSSVMMRRSAIDAVGAYSTSVDRFPEDFDLWSRVARCFKVANLPEILHSYREIPTSISRAKSVLLQEKALGIAYDNLVAVLNQQFHQSLLLDLAAIVRFADQHVSAHPDWAGLNRVVSALRDSLSRRFPLEQDAIARGEAFARRALRRARLRHALGSEALWALARRLRHLVP